MLTHRIPIRTSQDHRSPAPTLSLSQLATSFISSQAKPSLYWRRHISIFSHNITRLYTTIIASPGLGVPATSFTEQFLVQLHLFLLKKVWATHTTQLCFKEVIRPQVPLRSPCYDFSLVAKLVFDDVN